MRFPFIEAVTETMKTDCAARLRDEAGPRSKGCTIEVYESETEVTSETLNRAVELLARWALRRGQKVLEEAGVKSNDLVTGGNIKGYGDNGGSN